jgi:hypothetical protein
VSVVKRHRNGPNRLTLVIIVDFLPEDIRTIMEQGYAYKPSAPAPLSAAPPSEYPREAFGTRSSVDLSRLSVRMEPGKSKTGDINGKGSGVGAPPHILFDTEDVDEGDNADESNDWGNSDEESSSRRVATPLSNTTTNGR